MSFTSSAMGPTLHSKINRQPDTRRHYVNPSWLTPSVGSRPLGPGCRLQIAVDEGRLFINGLRGSSALRRARNDAALLLLMNSELPIELKDELRRAATCSAPAWPC